MELVRPNAIVMPYTNKCRRAHRVIVRRRLATCFDFCLHGVQHRTQLGIPRWGAREGTIFAPLSRLGLRSLAANNLEADIPLLLNLRRAITTYVSPSKC